ncbi:unnamed protein product [Cylindrotheca closterium]|uniref:Nuclear condensin complex subunit 3 C-terminal domain-containing protein n=1 Tax=Cylindrotheca closterium TaxID=2856 RepID=A0AAD2G8G3_9STRA|nr:unnamed protein product [Cylindrotheca closterium]
MEAVIAIICGELEKKLSKKDEVMHSARAMALEIQKSVTVSDLEESMSKVSLVKDDDPFPEVKNGILPIYLRLLDKSMSLQSTKNDDETLELFMGLVAALSVLSGANVAEALVRRTVLYSNSILERVRKRALVFIGFLVAHVSEELREGSSDLVSMMEDAVVLRLKDKSKTVRISAIEVSVSFLDAKCQSENLLNSLLWNLWHDPSAASRGSAVKALPINEMTIEHVIQRIRDSEKSVRVAALQALTATLDSVSLMSPDTFVEIIRGGFSDRCTATKEAMLSLVFCNWIEVLDYDLLQLLRQVDLFANEEECGVLISEIMSFLDACNDETPDYLNVVNIQALRASLVRQMGSFVQSIELKESATAEETFLFRLALCKGAKSPDMLSPENYKICSSLDTSELCNQIARHSLCLKNAIEEENPNRQEEYAFHCCHLMYIAGFVSISEEGSKRHFINFIEQFLTSRDTPDGLIDRSISTLFGFERKKIDSFGMVYRVLHRLSREVAEETKDEAWINARYIAILAPALEISPRDAIDEDFAFEISFMIAASITDTADDIRELAVSCLGKLGFFNPPTRVLGGINPSLLELALNEKEKLAIRSQALLSLCDLAMLSQEELQRQQRPNDSSSFVQALETLIRNSNPSVVALVGEVTMKLLLDGRSTERKLLASLVAIYFDPNQNKMDTEFSEARAVGSSIRLHQLLSVFFPAFVLKSDLNRDMLVGSLGLALEYSSNTKSGKSSKQGPRFPMLKMMEYIMAISENESRSVAISVCVQVARFLVSAGSLPAVQCRAFCSFILQHVTKTQLDSDANVRELNLILEDLRMIVQDESALESLSQAAGRLVDLEASRPNDDSALASDSDSTGSDSELSKTSVLADSTNASTCSSSKRYGGRKTQSIA